MEIFYFIVVRFRIGLRQAHFKPIENKKCYVFSLVLRFQFCLFVLDYSIRIDDSEKK